MKTNSDKNIPSSGDIVDRVRFNKNRSMGCIVFDSGKKIYFNTDHVIDKVLDATTTNVAESVHVNRPMVQNSLAVEEQKRAETLRKLASLTGEDIDYLDSSSGHVINEQMMNPSPVDDSDAIRRLIDRSENKSTRMAEMEYKKHNGGKL